MYKKQRELVEKILFDYYMISSIREDEIHSPFPFYMDKNAFEQMVSATETLDRVVKKVIERVLSRPENRLFEMGSFPYMDEVFNLSTPILPFFWVRYDAFEREKGGIFFSEFNYDKPCAQREIAISNLLNPENSPNYKFAEKFKKGFGEIIKHTGKQKPVVAILVDPAHYEEMHLAYFYIDLLKDLNCEFIISGAKNFLVNDGRVEAFEKEIDVILRQFPTEFLNEVNDFEEIIKLAKEGKVLIVNDPRAIIGQAKSLFGYLWEMVEKNDELLTEDERKVIKETIPYTTPFRLEHVDTLRKEKDKYVIKAVFGRYSEEVYIGKMHTEEEWEETLQYVLESDKAHIIQEFCPIRKEAVLRFNGSQYEEVEAFGNYGMYLTNGEFTGVCLRWSDDYLTADDTIWFTPVGVREESLKVENRLIQDREKLWESINDEAAFEYGYTGGYTGNMESFSLQALILDDKRAEEIKRASEELCKVFKKTTALVQENYKLMSPILGISDKLGELASQQRTDCAAFIGRLDWVVDSKGNLKLLEFNSETPGGIIESIIHTISIHQKLYSDLKNPNKDMSKKIAESFEKILEDYKKVRDIKTVGFVSSTFYEDWYNTNIIYEQVKHLPYDFVIGEVSGLEVREDKLYLYNKPLDAVYRHYPLDWFDTDEYYSGVIDALKHNTLSINPPSTIISQSKAFFALLWELVEKGFYSEEEGELIKRYIPKTTLDEKELNTLDYCIKPYFGREGQEIGFSIKGSKLPEEGEYIFQERIDIQRVNIDANSTVSNSKEPVYPVIGAFITGNEFAGFFTRAGGMVTNKWVVFLPTFIR